jgi:hypothetical protein
MGLLDTGAVKLRVVFHILNTEDGLMATMDSPDQGMKAMPATSVTRDGAWTQGGGKLRLVLKPVKDQSEMERRPLQKPTKPCRYREEDASCPNPQGRDESLPGQQGSAPRWGSQAVRVEIHPGQVFLARNHAERMVRDRDAIRQMPREKNFEHRAGS